VSSSDKISPPHGASSSTPREEFPAVLEAIEQAAASFSRAAQHEATGGSATVVAEKKSLPNPGIKEDTCEPNEGRPVVEALAQLVKRECKSVVLGKYNVQVQAKKRRPTSRRSCLSEDVLHAWLQFSVQGVAGGKRPPWLPSLLRSLDLALRCCGLDLTLQTQELVVHVESGYVVHISFAAAQVESI